MNTRIYMENPKGKKKSRVELGAWRELHYVGITKRVHSTWHTRLCQLTSYTANTHPPFTKSMLKPSSIKKEKLSSTQTLSISQEKTRGILSSSDCLHLHNKEHAYL